MSALQIIPPAPDLHRLIALATDSVQAENTRRAYGSALRGFLAWWASCGQPALTRETVHQYRTALQQAGGKAGRINQALAALTRLAAEAEACGAISYATFASIQRVDRIKQRGVPTGNWLDETQIAELLRTPAENTLLGLRDRAILALLIGTGLRRAELARLQVDQLAERDGRTVVLDCSGKGGTLRTVAVHDVAAEAARAWIAAAGITDGPLLRRMEKHDHVMQQGLTASGLYFIVANRYGAFEIAPHDLRRSLARIMHERGAGIVAIQQTLGHASPTTTQRYVNASQNLKRGQAGVDYWPGPDRSKRSASPDSL